MVSIGIVGLPNAGKSSLFKALTGEAVEIAKYPFTTIKPHHGIVKVPDETLEALGKITPGNKVIPAGIEFVDIAGLIKGAHKGEGLGNEFLSHIRKVDAILEVVRAFEDSTVPHPEGSIDPERDKKIIREELIQADLSQIERAFEKYQSETKSGRTENARIFEVLKKTKELLKNNHIIRERLNTEEANLLKEFNFLTSKPLLVILNNPDLPLNLLAETAELEESEAKEIIKNYGFDENPLQNLIRKAFELLDLITFYTVKPPETRAWNVKKGTLLPEAGGAIHSDFQEKFIRAEVILAETLLAIGDWHKAKSQGKIRTEGREYIVQDKDVIEFKI
ncbi:MAG: YchF family ATPase [Candidatus Sungbacteria bacterium]|nr:YchF family ATPase [Candidatus Sungbacteria bacterium]